MTDIKKRSDCRTQVRLLKEACRYSADQLIGGLTDLARTGASLESGHEPEQINGGIYND